MFMVLGAEPYLDDLTFPIFEWVCCEYGAFVSSSGSVFELWAVGCCRLSIKPLLVFTFGLCLLFWLFFAGLLLRSVHCSVFRPIGCAIKKSVVRKHGKFSFHLGCFQSPFYTVHLLHSSDVVLGTSFNILLIPRPWYLLVSSDWRSYGTIPYGVVVCWRWRL